MRIRIFCQYCKSMTLAIPHKPYNISIFFYCDSCKKIIGYEEE